MPPLLVHFCTLCCCATTIPFSASVFSQNHSCSHCGAVSAGINIRDEQKEAANMQQEELARLFSAQMNLDQASDQPPPYTPRQVPEEQSAQQQGLEQVSKPITYVSQHYTHSYHVVPVRQAAQEPTKTHIEASELEGILLRNSIDPSLLFPSQVELFQNAHDDQRLRLLELWRISLPRISHGLPAAMDYNTSR